MIKSAQLVIIILTHSNWQKQCRYDQLSTLLNSCNVRYFYILRLLVREKISTYYPFQKLILKSRNILLVEFLLVSTMGSKVTSDTNELHSGEVKSDFGFPKLHQKVHWVYSIRLYFISNLLRLCGGKINKS